MNTDDEDDAAIYESVARRSAAFHKAAAAPATMTAAEKLRYVNMLTVEQFQNLSNEFETTSRDAAVAEAAKYNERGVRGSTIHAVQLGDKFCVMLDTAAQTVAEWGTGKIVS